MKLTDHICAITGGSSGIGLAITRRLIAEGATAIILGKNRTEGRNAVRNLREKGKVIFLPCDVRKPRDIKHAMATIKKQYGRLDALINNAGIYPKEAAIEQITEKSWEDVLAVNLCGAFLMTKYAIPLLKKSRAPSITNIASELGVKPEKGSAAYCASKAALIMFTKVAALEYAPKIRVNAVAPGPIDTPLLRNAFANQKEIDEYTKKHTIFHRLGKPEEVAHVVHFLVSDEASYVTGALYPVDGGEAIA